MKTPLRSALLSTMMILLAGACASPTSVAPGAVAQPTQAPAIAIAKVTGVAKALHTSPPAPLAYPPAARKAPGMSPPDKPPVRNNGLARCAAQALQGQGNQAAADSLKDQPAVAYIFPDAATAAIAAAPLNGVIVPAQGLSEVGVVEIGPGQDVFPPGAYLVAIDLSQQQGRADGALLDCAGTKVFRPLSFSATPLTARPGQEPVYAPNMADVSIGADHVCFLHVGDDARSAVRYCSTDPSLSVRALFPSEYANLQALIKEEAARLQCDAVRDLDPQKIGDADIIAEMEDFSRIKACGNDEAQCGADIVGAPLAGKPSSGLVGLVRVLKLLRFEGYQPIEPGVYVVRTEVNQDNLLVQNAFVQGCESGNDRPVRIPAFPQSYWPGDRAQDSISEISAWHLGICCLFWQSRCP